MVLRVERAAGEVLQRSPRGYLIIVLHAHLPFVRHPEQERFLEENWFYQAVTECYLPLIDVFGRLTREGVRFRITLSLSPPLITMLTDELLTRRYVAHLDRLLRLAEAEKKRTAGTEFYPLVLMYEERLNRYRDLFTNEYQRNLVAGFASFQDRGVLEIITTCATHGYLPLIRGKEARRAQISVGVDLYKRHFGHYPKGFWLPECGYAKGVDEILASYGIRYFFLDTHGILGASPLPPFGVFAPIRTAAGVAAFGRDPDTSRQVWDRQIGYPGDYWYREYYRDIGYELPWEYIEPFLPSAGVRTDTGFKYYRITGSEKKRPYEPHMAQERVSAHAEHFLHHRRRQVSYWAKRLGIEPVIVSPYDAELFGHWWYEGPQWLEILIRKVCSEQDTVLLATPSDYLAVYPEHEMATLSLSSWGEGGYSETWLNPANDWIYPHTHHAESRMVELCDLFPEAGGLLKKTLNQAARELLLAQSSDWAFILRVGSTVEYATRRLKEHIARFNYLTDSAIDQKIDQKTLEELSAVDNIFPEIDYRVYSRFWIGSGSRTGLPLRILILSWEYPPHIVGGLGRHVYDLSRHLVRLGNEVTVVTASVEGSPPAEVIEGVEVRRVPVEGRERDFLDWVAHLNKGILEEVDRLWSQGETFDVIHGHDWLIEEAARQLNTRTGLPLVVTVHATEYGRHGGIHNQLQYTVHAAEERLVKSAGRVICCSEYMAGEVARLFGLQPGKITVIPNGVDPEILGITGWRGLAQAATIPVILFLGRLVPEKGVQDLIRALPLVAEHIPGARAVICGHGPYEGEIRRLVDEVGVAGRVCLAGFVDGAARNTLLQEAAVAVFPSHYEPFGIVALEAMAAQVPVVVGDTGGLSEVVEHGVDGFKVPPGRPDLLARYIRELLTNRPLAEELCRRAWRKVRSTYNWSHIAAVTCEVYSQLCSSFQQPKI
ncbi:MAG: 1,4-alpha-glucan branching protein domain-containing protein [Bacillota bacterium]